MRRKVRLKAFGISFTVQTLPFTRLPILLDPPLVIWMSLLCVALGRRALRWLRAPLDDVRLAERAIIAFALGIGLLQYLPYCLGIVGIISSAKILTSASIWLGLAALTVVLAAEIRALLAGALESVRRFRGWFRSESGRRMAPTVICAAILAGLICTYALAPEPYGNDDGYHLTAPKRWIQAGAFTYLPTMTHTTAPMGMEMLFLLPLATWSDTAARLFAVVVGLAAAAAIVILGRRFKSTIVGVLAAVLVAVGLPAFDLVVWTSEANVDTGVMLEVVCAVLAALIWLRSKNRRWLFCAGLLAGFAASFKLTAIAVGLVISLVAGMESLRARESSRNVIRDCAIAAGLAMLPVLPWLLRSWVLTGNPIYPILSGVFPTRDWSSEQASAFTTYFKYYNWGKFLGGWLTLGQRKLLCAGAGAVLLVGAAIAHFRLRNRDQRMVGLICCFTLFVLISASGLYVRFLLPIVPLVYLFILAWIAGRVRLDRFAYVCAPAVLILLFARHAVASRRLLTSKLGYELGFTTREALLTRDHTGFYKMLEFANREIPVGEPLLLAAMHPSCAVSSGGALFSDHRCYVTDAYLQGCLRMDTWDHFIHDIRRERIKYAIFAEGEGYGQFGPKFASADNEYPFALRLGTGGSKLVFSSVHFRLYKLPDGGSSDTQVNR